MVTVTTFLRQVPISFLTKSVNFTVLYFQVFVKDAYTHKAKLKDLTLDWDGPWFFSLKIHPDN